MITYLSSVNEKVFIKFLQTTSRTQQHTEEYTLQIGGFSIYLQFSLMSRIVNVNNALDTVVEELHNNASRSWRLKHDNDMATGELMKTFT